MISGKQGSGKTTLAKALLKYFEEKNIKTRVLKFADPLYEMEEAVCSILNKYDIIVPRPQKVFLQLAGTEWCRNTVDNDIWAKILYNRVTKLDFDGVTIVDDLRFRNELDILKDQALSIRLTAPREIRKPRTDRWRENETHLSETDLDEYEQNKAFDLYFDTSKDSLEIEVETIHNSLK